MLLKQNYFLGALILGSIAAAQPALATVNFGSSNGYGVAVVTPPILPRQPFLPTPFVSGSAPAPYNTPGLNPGPLHYTSGSLDLAVFGSQAHVRSDVDGLPGVRTTTGFGEVNDDVIVTLGSDASGTLILAGHPLGPTIFRSEARVTGEYGNLTPSGVSSIFGLSLIFDPALAGDPAEVFNLMGTANAAPNTNLVSFLAGYDGILGGLSTSGVTSIILNEQSGSCNGIDFCEIDVNALHIYGSNEVILGHSYAMQTALPVPEASTYNMMLAGLGIIGVMVARCRKQIPQLL